MRVKHLWVLLIFAYVFFASWIMSEVLPSDVWYRFPTYISLGGVGVYLVYWIVEKVSDD